MVASLQVDQMDCIVQPLPVAFVVFSFTGSFAWNGTFVLLPGSGGSGADRGCCKAGCQHS